jgi:hypothetical protein
MAAGPLDWGMTRGSLRQLEIAIVVEGMMNE